MTPPIPISSRRATGPVLFRAVRRSRDLPLIAFAVALFVALAAQAGAFLPRLEETRGARPAALAESAKTVTAASPRLACETAPPGAAGVPRC